VEIFGIPVGQLTINGLALLAIATVVTGYATGFLVPKRTHDRELDQEARRTADWKELWSIANQRGDVMESVATDLVVVGENVNKLLQSLPPAKGGN
jgi:hypothetical protein